MTAAEGRVPVLVLLSADWAGPSRPAPTLLRELARRWGSSMHTLLVEDPDDGILDRWQVEHLPTWLRFVPADEGGADEPLGHEGPEGDEGAAHVVEAELRGLSPRGEESLLPGPWRLDVRRSGALPKHVVDAELGPLAVPDAAVKPVPGDCQIT